MLNLTPLEETIAVKEIIQISKEEGRDEGKLIGQIHMAQRLMKKPITPMEILIEQNIDELRAILDMMEPELSRIEVGSA